MCAAEGSPPDARARGSTSPAVAHEEALSCTHEQGRHSNCGAAGERGEAAESGARTRGGTHVYKQDPRNYDVLILIRDGMDGSTSLVRGGQGGRGHIWLLQLGEGQRQRPVREGGGGIKGAPTTSRAW